MKHYSLTETEMEIIRTASSLNLEVILDQLAASTYHPRSVVVEQAMLTELKSRGYTFNY